MSQYTSLCNTQILNVVGTNMLPSPTLIFLNAPVHFPLQYPNDEYFRSQYAAYPNTLLLNVLVHFSLQHQNFECCRSQYAAFSNTLWFNVNFTIVLPIFPYFCLPWPCCRQPQLSVPCRWLPKKSYFLLAFENAPKSHV